MKATRQRLISLSLCVVILIFSMTIPASARASAYFDFTNAYVSDAGNGAVRIKVHVLATGTMQEVGATQVVVYEKQSNGSYTSVFTFTREKYPSLITKNRLSYITYVTYPGDTGKSYYVSVAFYAKNLSGSQTKWGTSNIVET